jgi:hypothetical protein
VFTRSLFPQPRPDNLITAPAHRACNGSYQLDEEYFRVFALSGLPNEAARSLWEGPVRRSFKRQPAFRDRIVSQIRRLDVRSPAGLYLGSVDAIQAERERLDRVIRKFTRGLAFHHLGLLLLGNSFVEPYLLFWPGAPPLPDETLAIIRGLGATVRLGESVAYRVGQAADEPAVSVWLLQFYDRHSWLVLAGPEDSPLPARAARMRHAGAAMAFESPAAESESGR